MSKQFNLLAYKIQTIASNNKSDFDEKSAMDIISYMIRCGMWNGGVWKSFERMDSHMIRIAIVALSIGSIVVSVLPTKVADNHIKMLSTTNIALVMLILLPMDAKIFRAEDASTNEGRVGVSNVSYMCVTLMPFY